MHRRRFPVLVRSHSTDLDVLTLTPSQLCRRHAAHLRTRQFSRLQPSFPSILSLLLSRLAKLTLPPFLAELRWYVMPCGSRLWT